MSPRALLLPLVAALATACTATPPAGERTGATSQSFTSAEAVLADFEWDGRLVADTADPATLRSLIEAQLMYTVGPLNAERSIGRHERLELSQIRATRAAKAGFHDVTYHAVLPVAWGASKLPTAYALTLPMRASAPAQSAFASKYGTKCVDPSFGTVDASHMFLAFRPQAKGCALDPADAYTVNAKVTRSSENTSGKYPEYDRIWEDGALRFVAIFSHELDDDNATARDDEGVAAYESFVAEADAYLRRVQPDEKKRSKLSATLPDGREVAIAVKLVPSSFERTDDDFDAWYDALTPSADVIVYSGHAGLGANVRALAQKGKFVPGKYLMWISNGCDTFAYVDRTLASRRALLNADDPTGTKHMDVVSNVLAGYFSTADETSLTVLSAVVSATDTYEQVFTRIDREQLIAVTGEEDNQFVPGGAGPKGAAGPGAGAPVGASVAHGVEPSGPLQLSSASPTMSPTGDASESERGACAASPEGRARRGGGALTTLAFLALVLACRRRGR